MKHYTAFLLSALLLLGLSSCETIGQEDMTLEVTSREMASNKSPSTKNEDFSKEETSSQQQSVKTSSQEPTKNTANHISSHTTSEKTTSSEESSKQNTSEKESSSQSESSKANTSEDSASKNNQNNSSSKSAASSESDKESSSSPESKSIEASSQSQAETDGIYTDADISIFYPILSGNNSINRLIRQEAISGLGRIYPNTDGNLSGKINYTISTQTKNLLSISYQGDIMAAGAAYPSSVNYTTNIDLRTGKKIVLADVIQINDEFVQMLMDHAKQTMGKELVQYLEEQIGIQGLKTRLLSTDQGSNNYSLYTDGLLTILLEAPSCGGGLYSNRLSRTRSLESLCKRSSII